MNGLLPFIVAGLVTGSLYGLAASGLVLTYKTSGIFNFAHGAIGAGSAFLFYELRDRQQLPWPVAMILAVFVLAPLAGVVLSGIAGRLAAASTVRRVVATVGILLLVQGSIQLHYGIAPLPLSSSFPTDTVGVFGTRVGYDQIISATVAVCALVLLDQLFRRTRLGLEMRAVVDNDQLLDLAGGVPRRVRALSWMIGASFAALSGVLFAPTVGLDSVLLTLLVVQAIGAAAIGRFNHLGATFAGGLLIGVLQALLRAPDVNQALPFLRSLRGLDQSVSFLILFGLLLVARRGTFAAATFRRAPRVTRRLPLPGRLAAGVLALTGIVLLPVWQPSRAPVLILAAVFVTIFASLYLLVEVSGQVSLCQTAFVAVGAASFSHLTVDAGLPWLVGVAVAALIAVPVGVVVALPAIRLAGVFLALATLGFGVLMEQMAYNQSFMFGELGRRTGQRPAMLGLDTDRGYFYLCAGFAVLAIGVVVVIRRSRLGRLLNALADSPTALVTHGSNVNVTRLLVFCIAAAMASVGGALSVGVVGTVSSVGVSPTALISFNSLLWLAALSFSGRNVIVAPVLAAAGLVVLPSLFTSPHVAQYLTIAFGVTALASALSAEDLPRWFAAHRAQSRARLRHSPVRERSTATTIPTPAGPEVLGV